VPSEPCTGERLRYNHYTEIDGKKNPLQFWVESVDVTVKRTDVVSVPSELLERHPNQFELLSKGQQDELERLVVLLGAVAKRAFDLWIRTLRWKCKNSSIGRPEISGHNSGWSTCLTAQPSGHRIWLAGVTFTARASKMVTPAIWETAGCALRAGRRPPVYIDLLMDAEDHMKMGDLPRAAVEIAMSCEVFLRSLLADSLPPALQPSVSQYIDDANIRQVLENFSRDILSTEELKVVKRIKRELHKLFDARNAIVHKGITADLTQPLCKSWLEAATLFLEIRE